MYPQESLRRTVVTLKRHGLPGTPYACSIARELELSHTMS